MELIEIILLIGAYTLLILSIFLQLVCYKKNLEFLETILFTVSLLFLIISISATALFPNLGVKEESANLYVLLSMILVGASTPINIFKERQISGSENWKKYIIGGSIGLFLATFIGYFSNKLVYAQYLIIGFLSLSIILSMLLVRNSQPIKRLVHREKVERKMAIAFIVIIPLCLISEFYLSQRIQLEIGFLLPLTFLILAGSKIWDDLERLALFKTDLEGKAQNLKNYAFTAREKEIALFLTKGMTYKQISEQLYIAIPTVKTHVTNIYRKCGVKNKHELTSLLIN